MERDAASCAEAQHDRAPGQQVEFDLDNISGPIHFIGLGGIGMSAIARLLLADGKPVSGSDQSDSEIMRELAHLGAKTFVGHAADNVAEAGAVVISTAINQTNPELARAHELCLPIMHRSDVLRQLSKKSKLIAISGTHGKTTTTGMVSQVLLDCGFDPSVVVGGIFARIGSNSHFGKGEYFVAEADESDRTHGQVTSYISVITNIEADHLENYPGGLSQIKDVMVAFANKSERAVVICQDDAGCRSIMQQIAAPKITYGKLNPDKPATYQYEQIDNLTMRAYKGSTPLGEVKFAVPGEHNMLNGLAAVAIASELGAEFGAVADALAHFHGVDRRFQLMGEANNVLVVDDYAHHPTELVATLKAAKEFMPSYGNGKKLSRVVAIFQPHQPTRLRDLWDEFCRSFVDADLILLADVYVARGAAIEGINSLRLSQAVKHSNCQYVSGKVDELVDKVVPLLKPGDLVLTIGAGDITQAGPKILDRLKQSSSK